MMNSHSPNYTVSFTVNTCVTDVPFLDKTLRHILRSLNYPFYERLVTVDVSEPKGHFRERQRSSVAELRHILNRLLMEGLIDRIDEVCWEEDQQKQIFCKYFGRDDIEARCAGGTAVYQYLFALDQCKGDYVLHVDSDMLFHCDSEQAWIEDGVNLMRENPSVVITTPSHPPQAESFLELLLGKPINRPPQPQWQIAQGVSTRYFLYDRNRLEQNVLPLIQRNPAERLEESLTYTLKNKGFKRCSLGNSATWVIHPKPHNDNYIRYLDDLIWGVENNIYPFRRIGPYPWDLYTYNRYILPWLWRIRRAKANTY